MLPGLGGRPPASAPAVAFTTAPGSKNAVDLSHCARFVFSHALSTNPTPRSIIGRVSTGTKVPPLPCAQRGLLPCFLRVFLWFLDILFQLLGLGGRTRAAASEASAASRKRSPVYRLRPTMDVRDEAKVEYIDARRVLNHGSQQPMSAVSPALMLGEVSPP